LPKEEKVEMDLTVPEKKKLQPFYLLRRSFHISLDCFYRRKNGKNSTALRSSTQRPSHELASHVRNINVKYRFKYLSIRTDKSQILLSIL